jgi:hypothetical protein
MRVPRQDPVPQKLAAGQEVREYAVRLGFRRSWFKIRQLTDVSHCNLQHHFYCNRYRAAQYLSRVPPRESRAL